MAIKPNIFKIVENMLGAGKGYSSSKEEVDIMLQESVYASYTPCMICGNPAIYRLVPKISSVNSAFIQDKGYICEHCIKTNTNISKEQYGIRELEDSYGKA